MSEAPVLFGKKILQHHMLNYSEQIYDILVREIERGRWEVNQRLPGVMNLARDLGVGTKTVQKAYDRLKEEGYVLSRGYRGTFLTATRPQSAASDGRLGVLTSESQQDNDLIRWYEHVILETARKRGLLLVTKTLGVDCEESDVLSGDGVFGADVLGVVSLTPFRIPYFDAGSRPDVPLVFLCPPFEDCTPRVSADVEEAYYDLTRRMIHYGYRQLLFSEDAIESDPRQTEMHRAGYLRAMVEGDMDVDEEFARASRSVDNADASSIADHLTAVKRLASRAPTVVIADSLGRSTVMNRHAETSPVRIPDDFAVVSIGSARTGTDNTIELTGMLPDFDQMADACLSILERQRQSGKMNVTRQYVRMHFVEGTTARRVSPR